MAIRYTYDDSENRVRTAVAGQVGAQDFRAYCSEILADERIRPGFIETLEIAPDAEVDVSFRDCLPFAKVWEAYVAKGVLGTIALPMNPSAYGIFRMFAGVIDSAEVTPGPDFRVVASRSEMESRVREIRATAVSGVNEDRAAI